MLNELKELRDCPWEDWLNCQEPQLSHYYEPNAGLFIAESPNVIERALHAGYVPVSWLIDKAEFSPQVQQLIADSADVPVYLADTAVLNSIRGLHLTRGVLCAMRRRDPCFQPDMLSGMQRIALLENIMNPTNLGAVFRSAAALSIDAVLLTKGCTDPLYRRAARVSMGTVFQVPWAVLPDAPNAAETVRSLHEAGWCSAAMALNDDSVSIDDPRLKAAQKLMIVLGTEGSGLADETIAACDFTVKIPMSHGVDSLNVAAASAVAFWELRFRKKI